MRLTVRSITTLALTSWVLGCGSEQDARTSGAPPTPSQPAPSAASRNQTLAPRADADLNVLLITLDTVRADALNPYGQPHVTSPNIDRLAREGVLFEQVVASAPTTLPSHATIMTGRFPFAHGVRSNTGYVLPAANVTLAEVLKARGYRTGAEIAAPVLGGSTQMSQGFDRFRDLSSSDVTRIQAQIGGADGQARAVALDERSAEDITRFGVRFLNENRSRRFFLWLHYFDPHRLYIPRPDFQSQLPDDPYLAEILYTDHHIGELIRHLESSGLRSHTLIALTSDHGEGLGEHGEESHAFFVYDSTLRVPLIFWGPPRLPVGKRIASLVRTVDIAPTILDLLGLPELSSVQGTSLLPLIRGETQALDLPAYGESIEIATLFSGAPLRSLRYGDWKYIHQVDPELYDVANDPMETKNLAASHPEKLAELRGRLQALIAEAGPAPGGAAVQLDGATAQQLQALGYVAVGEVSGLDEKLASLELVGPSPSDVAEDIGRYARASGLAENGFHREAVPILREQAARHPDSPMIHLSYGQSLAALGKNEEARRALERALELSGCSVLARGELSDVLGALADYEAQLEVLRTGVTQCAESYELLNNYAYALATVPRDDLRDGAAAVRAATRAAELTGEQDPNVLDTLAAAHAEADDFEQATRVAQRAVRLARQQGVEPQLLAVLEQSLARYRAGQPTRAE